MDLRHLKNFIAVAEELNIGRAAQRLYISQPHLTRQIQQLEEELDVELLVRTPKGVELTQAGEMFLEEAQNIRALMEQGIERTKRASQGKIGRLDIGIFGTGILQYVPEILLIFKETHPDVNVVMTTMSKNEQIEALRQKRINVGFHRMPLMIPEIENLLIVDELLYLVVNVDNPLSQQESVSFMELAKHPLVLYSTEARPNYSDRIIELCREKGFAPKISQAVGDVVSGIALVAGGFGITIVPESGKKLNLSGVVYRPFSDAGDATIDFSCIYRKDDNSAIFQAFLAVIHKYKELHQLKSE
jgi:LysR family transcriptional regulator, benzoate and cis,cis-muconate-responsive activator of ben and cat genes